MTLSLFPEYQEIALTRGLTALVDEEDSVLVSSFQWHAAPDGRDFYAEAWVHKGPPRKRDSMHRLVMGCTKGDGKIVDHINGNTLDNRKSNLRFVTRAQNMMNRRLPSESASGHRGVSFCKNTGKWKARLVLDQKEIWLGRFFLKEDAIRAAHEARRQHYGEYARTA